MLEPARRAASRPHLETPRRSAPAAAQKNGRARERILSVALGLFADRGFDGVSTVEIAVLAGISQSMVIYHFGSKETLWRESMRLLFDRLSAEAPNADILTDLDPLSRLKVMLRGLVQTAARFPELGRVILREGSAGGERLDWLRNTLLAPHYDVFTRHFEAACAAGRLKACDPIMAMIMLQSAAAMLFNLAPLTEKLMGRSPFDPDVVREQADLLVSVALNGLLKEDHT